MLSQAITTIRFPLMLQRVPFQYGIKDVTGLLWSDSDNSAAPSPAAAQRSPPRSMGVIQFPSSLSPHKACKGSTVEQVRLRA